ncbi:hypothetical protein PGB28_20430 [Primorskyibacter aestuariivivens]|uniref:hypothetical protein n=1 Tax=Primorskyibacter aestuariivivens TaxID=1888912 RepID=UPI00230066AF|nr:hypothetical protein [Primorskyibacter aestuariivivens]MDA7430835.1 hypothetical protein [Primorskyibacter aestuariivivens]
MSIIAAVLILVSAAHAQARGPLPGSAESRKISVVVDRGITHTNQLPTSLRPLRKAMVGGAAMSDADLRTLAERGDGLAALRLTKRLKSDGLAENAVDIAFYASIAAGAGRVSTLDEMIEALYLLAPEQMPRERLRPVIGVLYAHAWAGNTRALGAVIDLNGRDQLFGEMSEKTRNRLLDMGRKLGTGQIELRLAMKELAENSGDAATRERVIGYLIRAERMGDLAVQAIAQNLRRTLGDVPNAQY